MADQAQGRGRSAPFSVVIPAHDEARVIGRCLAAMLEDAPRDALPEILVVANGCSDDTAQVARRAAPMARVIELEGASKAAALNAGSGAARAVPRLFVDADVTCSHASLAAVAQALSDGRAMAASPAMQLDMAGCDRWVRAYYRVWMTQPYVTDNLIGGGVYGLSAEGLARVGAFPPVIGDDVYVRTRFASGERLNIARDAAGNPVSVRVVPPRTARDQIRVEARRRAGSDEVRLMHPGEHNRGRINRAGDLRTALARGASLADVAIYLAMKGAARLLARLNRLSGKGRSWTRDESSRGG